MGAAPFSERPILVTGSAGFIGSNFVLDWLADGGGPVIGLDKLTYAGNLSNLATLKSNPRHLFVRGDIGDADLVRRLLAEYKPRAIVHFAAETHVDRSIRAPEEFVQTNVVGTFRLLEEGYRYFDGLEAGEKAVFRFLHVSTDEVYGSLPPDAPAFSEKSPVLPNSPYAASKAGSDHLARAYYRTYGLPVLTTNCSNNYGPYQFPEKLIPLIIFNALEGKALPVYGDGAHVRDWLYVGDHCRALRLVLESGSIGEVYNIGGGCEMKNIDVVRALCGVLDTRRPLKDGGCRQDLISHVRDRLGHDRRYAIDASKIKQDLGWSPQETFASGIEKTVLWYLDHQEWVKEVADGSYRQWVDVHYAENLQVPS